MSLIILDTDTLCVCVCVGLCVGFVEGSLNLVYTEVISGGSFASRTFAQKIKIKQHCGLFLDSKLVRDYHQLKVK